MDKKELERIADEHFGAFPVASIELKPLIQREDIHKRLTSCIIEMITSYNLPYYGEFCQFINFWEAKIGTCGVNVTEKGMNFYWDREWIESRTRKELMFTIVHEVFHLLFDHQKRGVGYDHKIANLAADMIINSIIHGDLMIGEGLTKMIEIPKDQFGNNTVVFLPKAYKGPAIFEEVYAYLLKEYNDWRNKNSDKVNDKKQVSFDKNGNITVDGKKYCKDCGQEMDEKEQDQDQDPQDGNGKQDPNDKQDGQGDENQKGQDGQGDELL